MQQRDSDSVSNKYWNMAASAKNNRIKKSFPDLPPGKHRTFNKAEEKNDTHQHGKVLGVHPLETSDPWLLGNHPIERIDRLLRHGNNNNQPDLQHRIGPHRQGAHLHNMARQEKGPGKSFSFLQNAHSKTKQGNIIKNSRQAEFSPSPTDAPKASPDFSRNIHLWITSLETVILPPSIDRQKFKIRRANTFPPFFAKVRHKPNKMNPRQQSIME